MQTSFEQHMKERRILNLRLQSIQRKFEGKQRNASQSESGSAQSTEHGSNPTKNDGDEECYNNDFWDDPFLNNFDGNEDLLSVNSFNSSMNFAKLQS